MAAVLDWELATLGHPLADLAYSAMPYHLPRGTPGLPSLPDPLPPGAWRCCSHSPPGQVSADSRAFGRQRCPSGGSAGGGRHGAVVTCAPVRCRLPT